MALRVLLGAYAALLALVGLLPTPVDRPAHRSLGRLVAWCAAHGLGFVDYARIEFTANILWFVPFGLLLGLIFGLRRWWYAPLLCLAASVVIESAQGLLLPERVASVGDVISNTLGGIVGTAIAMAALRVRMRRQRRSGSSD